MVLPPRMTQIAEALIDSYFIIDLEHNIVDFNRVFHAMLPRSLARSVRAKKCYEVLELDICKSSCIAKQCWSEGRHVRLDEITGCVAGTPQEMRFVLSAVPIHNVEGQLVGAMELQRNVTDEAVVQTKYQRQLDDCTRLQQQLERELLDLTRRVMRASARSRTAERELLRLSSGLRE